MLIDLLRRWLLPPEPPVLRPPGALADEQFAIACTRCDACRHACPQAILVRGEGGLPRVDFALGSCTFCSACREACAEPAFGPGGPSWKAMIDGRCHAMRGVLCLACRDACAERAVAFDFAGSPVPLPHVRQEACTGCGACVRACPARAIRVGRPEARLPA